MKIKLGPPSQTKAVALILLVALFYVGVDSFFHVFEIPQLKTLDLFFKWRTHFVKPQASLDEITVLTLDDMSIRNMDRQWPYRRSTYAYLLKEIVPLKPKVIAFDFVLVGEGILPQDDAFLEKSVEEAGNVILATFIDPKGRQIKSRKQFQNIALGQGVINKTEDVDGGVRRGRTFYWTDKDHFAEWAWELKVLMRVRGIDPKSARVEGTRLIMKDRQGKDWVLPLLANKTFDINFKAGMGKFRSIPFWKIFTRDYPKEAITDKIILVGLTSRVFHDEHPTPLELSGGVYLNANTILTLLDRDYLKRIPESWIKAVGVVLALLVVFLTWHLPMVWGFFAILFLEALVMGESLYALIRNFRSDFFSVPFLMLASFIITSFYRQIAHIIENTVLRQQAITDALTGQYTRRFLEVMLTRELHKVRTDYAHQIELEKRRGHIVHDLCVLMIDVDHFKLVNDHFGHAEGDRVLKEIADVLKKSCRKSDVLARYGGEEFCVVLPQTSKEESARVAEKLRQAVETNVSIRRDGKVQIVTISVGFASAVEDNLYEYGDVLRGADFALYQSKESGRNRVTAFHPAPVA